MSFNTFCGQDETNPLTYQRVLLRWQEGGGGGGIAAVNAGTNIDIPNPAVPVVALQNPLTAQLNLGGVDVLDTAGAVGAAGTVLSSLGAGNGTAWVAGGGGGIPSVAAGTNITIPNPAVPVVALSNPLTAVVNLDVQNITGTTGSITLNDLAGVNSQVVATAQQLNYIDNTGVFYSRMEVGGFSVVSNISDTRFIAGTVQNTNGAVLELQQSVVGGDIQLNCQADTDEVITNCNLKPFAITDTAASSRGAADNVLCSLGAAGGTRWTEIDRACVSYGLLINAPQTIRPIDSGVVGPAELTNGNFSFTVSQLYDPLVPFGTSQILTCEIDYQANFEKAIFTPARPLSSGGGGLGICVFNDDSTAGALGPYTFAPTQLTFVFDYLLNGVATQFDERVSIGQSTLTYLPPQVLALIPTAPAEAYAANVHLIGNIDCSGLNSTDTIQFRLLGYTSFAGLSIDTTAGGAGSYFGQIGIKCYMSRT
jgi:hypothetical protein